MNEEALKMYAELTQEISLCQDEDIKALGKGILVLAKNYDNSLKEIERLQSIIKEVREYLNNLRWFEMFSKEHDIKLYASTKDFYRDIEKILDKENK